MQRRWNEKVSGDPVQGWVQYTLERHFAGRLPLSRRLTPASRNLNASHAHTGDAIGRGFVEAVEARSASRHALSWARD